MVATNAPMMSRTREGAALARADTGAAADAGAREAIERVHQLAARNDDLAAVRPCTVGADDNSTEGSVYVATHVISTPRRS